MKILKKINTVEIVDVNHEGSGHIRTLDDAGQKAIKKFLKDNSDVPECKEVMATLRDKYSQAIAVRFEKEVFEVYAMFGVFRIGGGSVPYTSNGMSSTAAITEPLTDRFIETIK